MNDQCNMEKFGRQGEVHAILSGTKVFTNSKVDEGRLLRNDINILSFTIMI